MLAAAMTPGLAVSIYETIVSTCGNECKWCRRPRQGARRPRRGRGPAPVARRAGGGDRALAGHRPPSGGRARGPRPRPPRRRRPVRPRCAAHRPRSGRRPTACRSPPLRPTRWRSCATPPARACSSTSAKAIGGSASPRSSHPTGCAPSCRARRPLPLDVGSAGPPPGRRRHRRSSTGRERPGWVASVGEREAGVASVSAPVRDADGRVLAAVSVSGPIERTSRHPGRRYGDAVVAAARRVEREAGLRQE